MNRTCGIEERKQNGPNGVINKNDLLDLVCWYTTPTMAASDKAFGGIMLLTAAIVFVYYTIWAILLPFFDTTSPIHAYFPAREWAIRLPAFILVIGLAAIGTFVGVTVVKENRKKTQKARLRTA